VNEAEPAAEECRRILFLITGGRRDGNSETLARCAAAALPGEVEQEWLRLSDLPLAPFEDIRHTGDGIYPEPEANGRVLLDATLAATELVFVAPLYWYGLPTAAKHYLDHWSGWMRVPGVDFLARMAGKTMWAVTALSERDYRVADPLLGTLRLTSAYAKMHWGGALLGYGNRPGDILEDKQALALAARFLVRPYGGP
jgi:multimeric flavodoxin WrbA